MAGILKVDQVQSDSNLAINIAGSNVAFFAANTLLMGGNTIISSNKIVNSSLSAGAIVQVVRAEYTTQTSTTSTSWSNIGSASITPLSTSNKILIRAVYHVSGIGAMRFLRGATALNTPVNTYMTYAAYPSNNQGGWNSQSDRTTFVMEYYDSPATTNATTYNVEMAAYNITATAGFGVNEIHSGINFSGITLMEIAA